MSSTCKLREAASHGWMRTSRQLESSSAPHNTGTCAHVSTHTHTHTRHSRPGRRRTQLTCCSAGGCCRKGSGWGAAGPALGRTSSMSSCFCCSSVSPLTYSHTSRVHARDEGAQRTRLAQMHADSCPPAFLPRAALHKLLRRCA
eukprot:scaffold76473_cov25-Tisochrysis_lutea.AAC.1